ncbi:MAG: 3-deoxy-manno-octulosonate cytidylyltransferase [Verrucomicrobiota bacterium]
MHRDRTARILGVIPARWGSTRFPGKALHLLAGKPLVQHVWERCVEADKLDELVLATDDARIAEAAKKFGSNVVMTREDHATGTDRLAEVAGSRHDLTHLVNIQGDEPLIEPTLINSLADRLISKPDLEMITAANPIEDERDAGDPNVVKVVVGQGGQALYFSRSRIPFCRDSQPEFPLLRHHGIYGYTREFLLKFVTWPPSPLETCEKLEQLRALDHGTRIDVVITHEHSLGVDTPEQVAPIEKLLLARDKPVDVKTPACQTTLATNQS